MINRLVCSHRIGEISGNVVNHKDRDTLIIIIKFRNNFKVEKM
jgi:hypothetical protein